MGLKLSPAPGLASPNGRPVKGSMISVGAPVAGSKAWFATWPAPGLAGPGDLGSGSFGGGVRLARSGARHSHREWRGHRHGRRRAAIAGGVEDAFWLEAENCAFAPGSLRIAVNCFGTRDNRVARRPAVYIALPDCCDARGIDRRFYIAGMLEY